MKKEQPLFEMVEASDERASEQKEKDRELVEFLEQVIIGTGIPREYFGPHLGQAG